MSGAYQQCPNCRTKIDVEVPVCPVVNRFYAILPDGTKEHSDDVMVDGDGLIHILTWSKEDYHNRDGDWIWVEAPEGTKLMKV